MSVANCASFVVISMLSSVQEVDIMRKLMSVLLIFAIVLGTCGCFGPTSVDENLLNYYDDTAECEVTSVRFYYKEDGEYVFEELPEEQIDEFTDSLKSMKLVYHFAHTDYFWGDQFGIELALDDGTYLTYDGTQLEHSKVTIDTPYDKDNRIRSNFLEVSNVDFWEEMEGYFPSVRDEDGELRVYSSSW